MVLNAVRRRIEQLRPVRPGAPVGEHRLPAGLRVYAVGDIHGRDDLLKAMLERIATEEQRRGAVDWTVEAFVGDLIDRGPCSSRVIDLLVAPLPERRLRVCLRGNHEDYLLRFLEDAAVLDEWWRYEVALATLVSYGVAPRKLAGLDPIEKEKIRLELAAAMPPAHFDFFDKLWPYYEEGGYFFVHAGVNPALPLSRQTPDDLMFIREPFLSSASASAGGWCTATPRGRLSRSAPTGSTWTPAPTPPAGCRAR